MSVPHKIRLVDGDASTAQVQLGTIEPPEPIEFRIPAFVLDLSDSPGINSVLPKYTTNLHGTYLVDGTNTLVFGPHHIVDDNGTWFCESLRFKEQFIAKYA